MFYFVIVAIVAQSLEAPYIVKTALRKWSSYL